MKNRSSALLAAILAACGAVESPVLPQQVYTEGLVVSQDNAVLENVDVSNPNGVCITITGDNVTIRHSVIHNCRDHGVLYLGTNGGLFEDNLIYDAALVFPPNSVASGWPSSLKVQSRDETAAGLAQNITIRNNEISHGHGECMGLRGSHLLVEGNSVKDCFSVGIYSNGDHTTVQKNFVQCTGDATYNRGGLPMIGIGFAEESFSNWGAHGHDSQTVVNNIVVGCKYGVRYGSSTNGQGLSDTVIAYNTAVSNHQRRDFHHLLRWPEKPADREQHRALVVRRFARGEHRWKRRSRFPRLRRSGGSSIGGAASRAGLLSGDRRLRWKTPRGTI